jgi:hypothetical protein
VNIIDPDREEPLLVALVDFKWLMLGVGWRVDLMRWAHDERYARHCLHLARRSGNHVLRDRAGRLILRAWQRRAGASAVRPAGTTAGLRVAAHDFARPLK